MSQRGAPTGRSWWSVALGVGIVLVVIVAVSGALGRPDLPASGDADCEADGCEVWRADLGGGRVHTTDLYAVHEADGTLTVVDLADGAVVWTRELADGSPSELHADDEVIVAADPVDGGSGVALSTFATATGRAGLERTYDEWTTVSAMHRIGGELSMTVTPDDGEPAAARLMVSLADGEVRELISGPHTVIPWRDALVVSSADQVIGVADGGAAAVDWRADGTLTDIDLTSGRVLLRTSSDGYEVRAIATGARLWATPGGGVLQAQFIGTWVGLTLESGVTVVDPEEGSAAFERSGVPSTARVAHLALDRYTVVAWPVEDGVEVVAHAAYGSEVFGHAFPGADAAATWTTLAPVAGHPDWVQVVGDAGRRSTWLALPSGEVVRESFHEDPGPWDRDFAEGLLWRSRSDELVIEGPAGSLAIEGMTTVVSADPLLVHGPDGLVRLDPTPLFGTDG